jgi:non-specific serine/threonine protein kinase
MFGLPSFGSPFHSAARRQCADQTRRQLGDAAYAMNLQLGRAFDLERTVACALGRDSARPVPPSDAPVPRLTRREAQVAALIAEGLSNRGIAERLSIARRTVESYVENILAKLGFRACTRVAAWVVATGQPPPP